MPRPTTRGKPLIQPLGVAPATPLAMTLDEAALAARLGYNSIYKSIVSGELTAKKFGTKTLVLATDLQRWLESLPPYQPLHRVKMRGERPGAAADAAAAGEMDESGPIAPTHQCAPAAARGRHPEGV